MPFQFLGSPYLKDPRELKAYLEQWPELLDGLVIRPCSFMPTSQKWVKEEVMVSSYMSKTIMQ